jgi:ATP synthase protein I
MFRVVLFQFVISLVVAGGAGALAGVPAALTALFGGLACALPNGVFALHVARLSRNRQFPGSGTESPAAGSSSASAHALVILAGEFLKVALTVGLLTSIVLGYKDVVWLALVVSVGAVLIVQPFVFAWRR